MVLLSDRPHRRDMRLSGWDYRRPGPYAITICTQHRWHLFGHVTEGRMIPNAAGDMVMDAWEQMTETFPTVTFDAWVLMPNHFHAIVRLAATDLRFNPQLGNIVQGFKGLTTAQYAEEVHAGRWGPFDGRLWQRNYYDHIVRDETDLDRCRRYIMANPLNWATDVDREPDLLGSPYLEIVAAELSPQHRPSSSLPPIRRISESRLGQYEVALYESAGRRG